MESGELVELYNKEYYQITGRHPTDEEVEELKRSYEKAVNFIGSSNFDVRIEPEPKKDCGVRVMFKPHQTPSPA